MNPACLHGSLRRYVAAIVLAGAAFGLTGCGTAPAGVHHAGPPSTGRLIAATDLQRMLPGLVVGNRVYAEVNSEWLRSWYDEYRAELFRLGVVRWDLRFDCNRFAGLYSGLAQASFYDEAFHSRTPAQALALGPFWYVRDDGSGGHAVIQAVTERGRIFIDPQSGVELKLTGIELASAFLQYF